MKLIDITNMHTDGENCFHKNLEYCDHFDLDEWLDEQPIIDPIHVAGGCYCKECEYAERSFVEYSDNSITYFDNYFCNYFDSTMPLHGFCSEGKIKESDEK